jgi:hypothetical protein
VCGRRRDESAGKAADSRFVSSRAAHCKSDLLPRTPCVNPRTCLAAGEDREKRAKMSSGARDSFSIAHLLARPQQPVCPADSSAGQHHHEFVGSAAALFQRTMLPVPPAEEVHGVDSTSPSIGADSEGKNGLVCKFQQCAKLTSPSAALKFL